MEKFTLQFSHSKTPSSVIPAEAGIQEGILETHQIFSGSRVLSNRKLSALAKARTSSTVSKSRDDDFFYEGNSKSYGY